jgi:hypothetical protein
MLLNKSGQGSEDSLGGFMGSNNATINKVANGHSESDTTDTKITDGITDGKMATKYDDRNWGNSVSDTVGNSKNHLEGYMNSYTSVENYDLEYSEILNLAISSDMTNAKLNSTTLTTQISQFLEIPAGTYGVAALLLLTESTQVQFICLEG